ncbi:MAG: VOC family protein [Planctomycetota bacterium]
MKSFSLALSVLAFAWVVAGGEQDAAPRLFGEAQSPTIDIGVLVEDVEKSVEFYTEIIGFQKVPGFSVSGEFCQGAGLTDGCGLDIQVLRLGEGPGATSLKLMAAPDAKPKAGDRGFVHSRLGYRYLTIRLQNLTPVLARLEKSGVKPEAKSPVPLPGAGDEGPKLLLVRDPDGNLVELIGPKR